MDRQDEKFIYANFSRHYYISTIFNENNWQPVELKDKIVWNKPCSNKSLPNIYSFSVIFREIEMSKSPFCFEIFYTKQK